jgi:hypothetical protein
MVILTHGSRRWLRKCEDRIKHGKIRSRHDASYGGWLFRIMP